MAKRQAMKPEVIDVAPANPDVALVSSEGGMLAGLLGNIRQFMDVAQGLEVRAKGTLGAARDLQMPSNGDEDAVVQAFIRTANADKRVVEEHWSLTAKVHAFHRKLTAGRERAVAPLTEAADIANRLHNRYVEAEQRRVREEQDRIRREAEAEARRQQEAEAARLEQLALANEAASSDLSEREEQFVWAYVHGIGVAGNAAESARRAGYKNPDQAGARLVTLPKVMASIQVTREAAALRQQAQAVKAAPVVVEVPTVKADVQGSVGRTTWSAEVVDEAAFLAVLLDPTQRLRYGVPADVATYKPAALNEMARAVRENLDRIPGLRAVKTTRTY